ncbi:MAG: formate dehydrogenase accessory sulfurtransferase FdhD [Desulfuromonadales bacterium]|nr:formate dehydrogenase accessory sulfurtransferase FdhD [Desulfuromonadales bacterium]
MDAERKSTILKYEKGTLRQLEREVVQEFPLRLTVNGRELATLIASPHQLNFLVAGFLRLQGFVDCLDDIASLGVCAEFGAAQVRLNRHRLPERLRPVLTSGCGTGITFAAPGEELPKVNAGRRYGATEVTALMRELSHRAEQYRSHGGIHSAAVGDGAELLLFAEDLGRHNTLDRIAGEALFKGIDLAGKMLVTSGRVSTEMVAKAARLGIGLIASRTSPTDMAVQLSRQAGVTLIGYARGDAFDVYTHPERLVINLPAKAGSPPPRRSQTEQDQRIAGVTGVILAGGESRRMGSDKSLLPLRGARFIDHVYRCMAELFEEVLIVTNSPTLYHDLPCRKIADSYRGQGSLAGIHAGLQHAGSQRIFVAACDMPFLNAELIRELCRRPAADVVIPRTDIGLEPLHALYAKECLGAMAQTLDAGQRRIVSFFPAVGVQTVPAAELTLFDPQGLSFRNINTPEEYFALRERGKHDRRQPTAVLHGRLEMK